MPGATLLSADDLYLFNEGTHRRLFEKMGAHLGSFGGVDGAFFAVWAPDANRVSVIGDFNGWDRGPNPLTPRESSGIWEGFIPGLAKGARYKFHVSSSHLGYSAEKADPFAAYCELPPATASIVWDRDYQWSDQEWMGSRGHRQALDAPISIYEMHLGSWMRNTEEGNRFLTYKEMAPLLSDYITKLGFTHVEFLPVMEHPFYPSWGYQTSGYFAPTSRYGEPQDFMYLIDHLHGAGIGVILDWVPSHFPTDGFSLGYFDGTHLYEHEDRRQGFHPDWKSFIFNYGRNEVRSFLLSSAVQWLSEYHADALRVDGVASMLYLDYSREEGEWIPNKFGGRENLQASSFLKSMNTEIYGEHPDVQIIAEESTSWPGVSQPVYSGGLGFGLKWDMGWMHDTLVYFHEDPVNRKYHHDQITFRLLYAFSENFVLPLSHDEVVHGKGSLVSQMQGDDWQRFANLRLLLADMYAQPGKKLLFMGGEFGQSAEWNHDASLDWHLMQYPPHEGIHRWVAHLNRLYAGAPALHELDCDPHGFEWIDASDSDAGIISLLRKGRSDKDMFLIVLNFTPVTRHEYNIGCPAGGFWREAANSDGLEFGGSGQGNGRGAQAREPGAHGRPFSLFLTLPPLGCLFLKHEGFAKPGERS
ncbi:MAG: 1,4-alpha-glucan branching protein GlgB [Actinomycetota bacterium]